MTTETDSASVVAFHKMHGAGNDFVLLDLRQQELDLTAKQASRMANRRLGIGCDQLLILHHSDRPDCLLRYEIRNADGSLAGQCGNGARCIALYLHLGGEYREGQLLLESPAGPVRIERCEDGEFEVDMGEPRFEPENIPIGIKRAERHYLLDSPVGPIRFLAASMGNPHALIVVDELDNELVETVGPYLGQHDSFPEGCNVGFARLRDRKNLHLRVYERGAGETLACGSGACAAVAMLRREDKVDETVNVFLPGGHLVIKWPGTGFGVKMKGPATHVFKGRMLNE